MTIGVLAVQGDFAEHASALAAAGATTAEVRLPRDLAGVDGLVIPGGESTTIARLMDLYQLRAAVTERATAGMPVWGTCAGMIMLARSVADGRPEPLGLMDITVARNAYGGQQHSFEADLAIAELGDAPFPAVFIRAPAVMRVGEQVEVLAQLEDGTPVALRQGRYLATSFHPELTGDGRFHEAFVALVAARGAPP
jgi:5'-phosphate synthase pdxT subunit